jgi:hypothetical protein
MFYKYAHVVIPIPIAIGIGMVDMVGQIRIMPTW